MGEGRKEPQPDVTLTDSAAGAGEAPPDRTFTASGAGVAPAAAAQSSDADPGLELPVVGSHVYRIEEEVGRGGVGVVVRAHDRRLGRRVALKQLQYLEPRARLRFEREMRITAKLQHPGIVPIHEAGVLDSGAPFYAMKLIEGRSLKELIAGCKNLEERLQLLPHVLAVVETIAYAHSQGVIHRDLKPSNIIVGAYGETVVIDWGLAKELGTKDEPGADAGPYRAPSHDDMTQVGQVVGTPAYMAPEQARGEEVGKAADVYALGAVLRQVLTGSPPYPEKSSAEMLAAVIKGPPAPISEVAHKVPRDLCAVVDHAMARVPESRYQGTEELLQDLRSYVNGRLVGAYSYAAAERIGKWVLRWKGIVYAVVGASIVLTVVTVLFVARLLAERDAAMKSEQRAVESSKTLLLEQASRELDRSNAIRAFEVLRGYPKDAADWERVLPLVQRIAILGLPDAWHVRNETAVRGSRLGSDRQGRFVFVAGATYLDLWNTERRTVVRYPISEKSTAAKLRTLAVAEDALSVSAIMGLSDGDVIVSIFDRAAGGELISSRRLHACGHDGLNDMSTSSVSGWVAVGCNDGTVKVFKTAEDSVKTVAQHIRGRVNVVFLNEHEVGSVDVHGRLYRIELLNNQDVNPAKNIVDLGAEIVVTTANPTCGRLVAGTKEGRLVVLDYFSGVRLSETSDGRSGEPMMQVGIDRFCRYAFGLSVSYELTVVDVLKNAIVARMEARHAAFHPSGALVTGDEKGTVSYFDLDTRWKQTWPVGSEPIWMAVVSDSGSILAMNDVLAIYRPESIARSYSLTEPARTLATAEDDSKVLVGGATGDVALLSTSTELLSHHMAAHTGVALARAGDGNRLYSAGDADGCVVDWSDDEEPRQVFCAAGGVEDIAVGSAIDGEVVVSTRAGGLIKSSKSMGLVAVSGMGSIDRISLSQSNSSVLVGGRSGMIYYADPDLRVSEYVDFKPHHGWATWLPSGREFLISQTGGIFAVEQGPDADPLAKCQQRLIRSWVAPSMDLILAGCSEGEVLSWPPVDGLKGLKFGGAVADVDGTRSGRWLAAASRSGKLHVVDVVNGRTHVLNGAISLENLEVLESRGAVVVVSHEERVLAIWNYGLQRSYYPTNAQDCFDWLQQER